MSVDAWWDVSGSTFEDAEALTEFIIGTLNKITPQGTRGFTLWLGPAGTDPDDMPLRMDLDPDPGADPVESIEAIADLPRITLENVEGAAAVRWLPSELMAVDSEFTGRDIEVMEYSGEELVHVPANLARVSIPTAIQIAVHYVQTGERPTEITWEPAHHDEESPPSE